MKRLNTETRQEQIKSAVLEIISSEGLSNLSTRNLAAKVGVSEGAIFRHFKSKKDIIISIIEDVKTNLLTDLKIVAESNKPVDEKLFDFLCKHISYLIAHKGITILLFSEAAYMNEPDLKNRLYDILSIQKKLVSKIIKTGINEKKWDSDLSVDNVAMLYMGIPISLNIEMTLDKKGFKLDNFCRDMFSLLERVLIKK